MNCNAFFVLSVDYVAKRQSFNICVWMCITCFGYRWSATFYVDARIRTQSITFLNGWCVSNNTTLRRATVSFHAAHPSLPSIGNKSIEHCVCLCMPPDLLVNIRMSTFLIASSRCFIHVAKVIYTFWAQCMKLRRARRRGRENRQWWQRKTSETQRFNDDEHWTYALWMFIASKQTLKVSKMRVKRR